MHLRRCGCESICKAEREEFKKGRHDLMAVQV